VSILFLSQRNVFIARNKQELKQNQTNFAFPNSSTFNGSRFLRIALHSVFNATRNAQHATRNTQYATRNTQHAIRGTIPKQWFGREEFPRPRWGRRLIVCREQQQQQPRVP